MKASLMCLALGIVSILCFREAYGIPVYTSVSKPSIRTMLGDDGICRKGYKQVLGTATSCRYTCSAGDIGEGADFYTGEMSDGHRCRESGRFWGACKGGRCAPEESFTVSE